MQQTLPFKSYPFFQHTYKTKSLILIIISLIRAVTSGVEYLSSHVTINP